MLCPICGKSVGRLAPHFSKFSNTHPDYEVWSKTEQWAGKVEDEDFVRCRLCGFCSESLARHFKAIHKITADQYREQLGPILIRAQKVLRNRSEANRHRKGGHGKGGTKLIVCPDCGQPHEVSKFLSEDIHNPRCTHCKQAQLEQEEQTKWAGRTEPDDFVTCRVCGYRAENLTSHIQNVHPELIGTYSDRFPGAVIVALRSAVRDKTALQGRPLSEETRQKMSENAGRWNKGQTKETNNSLAAASEKMLGRVPWSKGLTKQDTPSLRSTSDKLKQYVGEQRPWGNGLKTDLLSADLTLFLDKDGKVDRRAAEQSLGMSWHTIWKHMKRLGLETSKKYQEQRAEGQIIRLERCDLEQFQLKNGCVSVGRAAIGLKHNYSVIRRECKRHDLKTTYRHLSQLLCLNAVSVVLGGATFVEEWESNAFLSPRTGRRFRFDGFFSSAGLVVEFYGHQHWMFPNAFMKEGRDEAKYQKTQEYDRIKRQLIEATPTLKYLIVREDEPFTDISYLRGRLFALGVPLPQIEGAS